MGFLQSADAVRTFINEEFPVFKNAVSAFEIDEKGCRVKFQNISDLLPVHQTGSGIEQIVCLLIDFSARLFAYYSTGSSHINNENISYLNIPESNEVIVSTQKMETSIAENAAAYRSTVLDEKGTEIALSMANQIIE